MNIILVTRDTIDGVGTTVKNLVWDYERDPKFDKITVVSPQPFAVTSDRVKFIQAKMYGKYFFTKEPSFAWNAWRAIKRELKHQDYDVIHLHSNILKYQLPNNQKSRLISTFQYTHHALMNLQVPIISTIHSTHIASISNTKVFNFKYGLGKYIHLPFAFWDNLRVRSSKIVTCVSKYTISELQKLNKGHESKFQYVPNGVDFDKYKPIEIDREAFLRENYGVETKGKKVLLLISRLESGKGVNFLADVVKEMSDVVLIILGHGPEQANLSKYENIKCLGYIKDQELKNKLINCADLFVFPSFYENFPSVIVEAMAAKLPILSTRVGMVPELLGDRDAVLVEANNYDEYTMKLKALLADDQKMHAEAELNYEYAHRELSWDKITSKYKELYQRLATEQ